MLMSELPGGSRAGGVFSTSVTQQRGIRYSGLPGEQHISQGVERSLRQQPIRQPHPVVCLLPQTIDGFFSPPPRTPSGLQCFDTIPE